MDRDIRESSLPSFLCLPLHGCQMAIAKFLDCRHLALRACRTVALLRYAAKFTTWQPCFSALSLSLYVSLFARKEERHHRK